MGTAWPGLSPEVKGEILAKVLGAYCTPTHEHLFLLTEDNINQDRLIELLQRLRAKHPGEGKLYLVLDNARYNHAKRVPTDTHYVCPYPCQDLSLDPERKIRPCRYDFGRY